MKPSPKDAQSQSRRTFLKGAALGALATVGAQVLSGCEETGSGAPDTGATCTPTWQFDRVADVVVIGSGTGLTAALAAAVAGSKVLVLEKSATTGGSTRLSGGVAWIPNNPIMKEAGIDDSREDAIAYLTKVARGQAEAALIEAFVDKGPEMVTFVADHTALDWTVAALLGDYHTEWPGARFSGRSIGPIEGDAFAQGPVLVGALEEGVKAAGGEILVNAPAKRLIVRPGDGANEVIGVEAEIDGATVRIRANQGVVLAAGGFDWDPELKRHFLRAPTEATIGHPGNTGDGLRLAMAVGADLRNMNECWGGVVFKEETEAARAQGKPGNINAMAQRRMPACITVNRYGERFGNEASPYDPAWLSFIRWENWGDLKDRNLPAYFVCDKKGRPSTVTVGLKQADTLRDLAGLLGVDADGLEATVAAFNASALEGKDPVYHRGESAYELGYGPTLSPLDKAPFYGVEVAPADLGTCGGARVNASAQVLDPFGNVIEGLYAAGNASGVGGPGAGYGGGGGTIGPGMTFAYIAGGHAAKRARLVLEGEGATADVG
jgi:3-oxosteroid 1-dehydrogenase